MIRVTNLIHRYNRKQGVNELEMALGEVTSDFGLPQWLTEAISAAPTGPTDEERFKAIFNQLVETPITPQAPMPDIPVESPSTPLSSPMDLFYGEIPMTSDVATPQQPWKGMDPFNREGWRVGPGAPTKKEESKWWEFWKWFR